MDTESIRKAIRIALIVLACRDEDQAWQPTYIANHIEPEIAAQHHIGELQAVIYCDGAHYRIAIVRSTRQKQTYRVRELAPFWDGHHYEYLRCTTRTDHLAIGQEIVDRISIRLLRGIGLKGPTEVDIRAYHSVQHRHQSRLTRQLAPIREEHSQLAHILKSVAEA